MSTTRAPASLPRPRDDEVHVWTALLSEVATDLFSLEQVLSPEEKQSAGRLHQPKDRTRYVTAHGILRQLLGRYLSAEPDKLVFVTNPFGKPELAPVAGRPSLSFNMAHSGEVILCAVAGAGRVGVDVEAIRTDFDLMELARTQFSPSEVETLEATDARERPQAFFRCWTRKEAYLKARGEGLGFPLKQFSVSFGQNERPAVRGAADDPAASERWSMFDLAPARGYAGAVVAEGRIISPAIRCWL